MNRGRLRAAFLRLAMPGKTKLRQAVDRLARETGLEPAASAVTGRRSNQLSYSRNPESDGRRSARRHRVEIRDGRPGVKLEFCA